MSHTPEKGINNNHAEGGVEKVTSPFFGPQESQKARTEAVNLLTGKAPAAAAARETSAPLPVGADMPGMGADRFSKLLQQAGPQDKSADIAGMMSQKQGNSAIKDHVADRIVQAAGGDHSQSLNATRNAHQPAHTDAAADAPKKRAS